MNAHIKNVCGDLREACAACWIFTVVLILFPITYVITSIVCCVPICCFNCCVFIIEFVKDKKNEENVVEDTEYILLILKLKVINFSSHF